MRRLGITRGNIGVFLYLVLDRVHKIYSFSALVLWWELRPTCIRDVHQSGILARPLSVGRPHCPGLYLTIIYQVSPQNCLLQAAKCAPC